MSSNHALQRNEKRGDPLVLAIDCALAGVDRVPRASAERGR